MKEKIFLGILIIILSAVSLSAEGPEDEKDEEEQSSIYFLFHPIGFIDCMAEFEYTGIPLLEGTETVFGLNLTGGWVSRNYFLDISDAYILPGTSGFNSEDAEFKKIYLDWQLGIRQGFFWNERIGENLLEGFIYYNGCYEYNINDPQRPQQYFFNYSGSAEADGQFQTSVEFGGAYNDVSINDHSVKEGIEALLQLDCGPDFLNRSADYYHLNTEIKVYIPIIDIEPERGFNLFNIYLAERFKLGYANGDYVPVNVRYDNRADIRGVERERFNTKFTVTNNLELRINFPALFLPALMPGFLVYFDSAFYFEEAGYQGFLISTGAGLYLDIFGFFQVGVRLDYLINDFKMDGKKLTFPGLMFQFQF
ncbi:MAG: hypothetical protein JEZ04_19900 [Spirochaetales bacterium]|nr:hypothetical protein [Spirochaetales bacterium]